MFTRRRLFGLIPAAFLATVLPSRLTRIVEASYAPNASPAPFHGFALTNSRRVPVYSEYLSILDYVDDCIAIAEWCGGRADMMHSEGDPGYDHIFLMAYYGPIHALPGEWIHRLPDGTFRVIPGYSRALELHNTAKHFRCLPSELALGQRDPNFDTAVFRIARSAGT